MEQLFECEKSTVYQAFDEVKDNLAFQGIPYSLRAKDGPDFEDISKSTLISVSLLKELHKSWLERPDFLMTLNDNEQYIEQLNTINAEASKSSELVLPDINKDQKKILKIKIEKFK